MKSLRLDYSGWSALSLCKISTTTTTSASTTVRFWLYTPTATTMKVYTSSSDNGGDASGFIFTTIANMWTEKIITNSQLGNPTQIKRIHIQNYTGNLATAYVDNLQLVAVTGARTGVGDEPTSNELTVFPNPMSGLVQIQYVADKAEPVQLQVIDATGVIRHQKAEQAELGTNVFRLDLSNQHAGMYLIRLQLSTGLKVKKIQLVR